MERDVGIVGYLTSTPGLGGTIKSAPEDFVVEEISSPPAVSPEGRYAIAQVRVRNWETNRLVRAMARALHISRKRIGYAGTKDKHAVTTRLFSFEGVLPEAVRGLQLKDVDIQTALRSYPKSYGFEKAILNQLAVEPTDYVGALRSLPFNLLMMFVHGYQSFLFNRILSERMRRRIPIHEPVAGDLVLPADASGLPDRSRPIDGSCDNLERAAKRCREGKAWVSAILFGSEPEFAGGEPGQIEKTIVASEGLRPEDFIIPEIPRISSKGTRREILAPFRGLDVQVGEAAFSLSFELTRGSYATCLVREFTKSE